MRQNQAGRFASLGPWATFVVLLQASPAVAHTGRSTHGLFTGLTHPLLGVDHLVAMITVGVLAVIIRRPIAAPAAFLGAMVVGGTLGIAGMPLPFGETAIALSVVALGGALFAGQAMQPHVALAFASLAGFVHGHAHGVEAPAATHAAIYVLGFVAATSILHASGVVIGLGIDRRPGARAAFGAVVLGAGVGLVAGVI